MDISLTIGEKLLKAKKNVSIAESCTGGSLSSQITDTPGSSRYFIMGIVAYTNRSKNKILNIPATIIKKYGVVSKKVAILMAKNVRKISKSDIGIGVTGIAGPGGATKDKPAGLVYIAISTKKLDTCRKFRFHGGRKAVKHKASQTALNFLSEILSNNIMN